VPLTTTSISPHVTHPPVYDPLPFTDHAIVDVLLAMLELVLFHDKVKLLPSYEVVVKDPLVAIYDTSFKIYLMLM
jgi:hypothetical protein